MSQNIVKYLVSPNKLISKATRLTEKLLESIKKSQYSDEDDSCSNYSDSSSESVDIDIVIKVLKKCKNLVTADECTDYNLNFNISHLISYGLFTFYLETSEENLIYLLNFIKWNCELVFKHAEDYACSEEDAGFSMCKLIDLSKKYNKRLTGLKCTTSMYSLLMAVQASSCIEAEEIIIKRKLKLTNDLKKSNDGLISDMISYFKKKKYNLLK